MPANKNAMTRYKILDELLSSRYHNYSLDDLTEEVSNRLADMYPDTHGVVRRTIEKDIYYLEYEGEDYENLKERRVIKFDITTKKKPFTSRYQIVAPEAEIPVAVLEEAPTILNILLQILIMTSMTILK